MKNIIFIIFFLFILNGCRMGPDTYEIFEYNMNFNLGRSGIPNANPKLREIYSKEIYIYLFKNNPNGCVYGFLTNRDNKPEKVIGWIIISGKEFCKEQRNYTF